MNIGIYQSYWGRVGGGQRYIAVVAEILARHHNVEIVHHAEQFSAADIEEPLDVDLSRINFRYVPRRERPAWSGGPRQRLKNEREWCRDISDGYDLYIDSSDNIPYFCHASHGVLLTHFPLVTYEQFHNQQDSQSISPLRWMKNRYHRWEWRNRFATYEHAIVNSRFTQGWLQRYWGLDADIVYPPLRDGLAPGNKEQRILTIGAFSAAQHKKHDVTLQAFCELCDSGLDGWEYVMIGAAGTSAADVEYIAKLREKAQGYPIRIRTNVDGNELTSTLAGAAILWHSMGHGVDAERDPGLMEHFGMVATEAMAAGAIPVVFKGGGLPEIVSHGEDGFLWSTPDELKSCTQQLIADECKCRTLSETAVTSASRFSPEEFERRLTDSLSSILN